MESVLLLVHDDDGLEARTAVALDLCRAAKTRLLCVDLTAPVATMAADPFYGVLLADSEVHGLARSRVEPIINASGVPVIWHERTGEIFEELAPFGSLASVFVLSSSGGPAIADMHGAIGDLLVTSKRSVMAVPRNCIGMKVSGKAMLLWDGSEEARYAANAAMPLLRQAKHVTILEVDDGSVLVPATAISDRLRQCRVPHGVLSVTALLGGTAGLILDQIALEKPDWVVMGGYGHPRFLEGLFGGVTERLLKECPVPLFLHH